VWRSPRRSGTGPPSGEGTTTALLALARELRDGVRNQFGITLEAEPVLVGAHL